MKALEANLMGFLQQPKQFVIPIYQRTYDWQRGQCEQLWRDLLRVGANGDSAGHFIGSIVYIARNAVAPLARIPEVLVIDGQQRLTTLTLLLAAFSRAIDARGVDIGISRKQLEAYSLMNPLEEGDLRFKLLLTQSDRETLTRLVEGREPPAHPSPRITENHAFFVEQLSRPSTDLAVVYAGLQKLMIVDIALERGRDNPQLIFESLNATGLKLSQADLIRNYMLMGLEPKAQTRIYEDHWYPMERAFGQTEYSERFDPFMRDYLTVRNGRIPNLDAIYSEFKAYVTQNNGNGQGTVPNVEEIEAIAADLHRFSRMYACVALGKEPDAELKRGFDALSRLRVEVANPFLVEMYEEYEAGRLSKADFLKILRRVESYVFRRAVCSVPTNSLNKTFAGLGREMKRAAPTPEAGVPEYLPAFEAAMAAKDGFRRFPRDEEFRAALASRDAYNFRLRNYLLDGLQNAGSKERADIEMYTIEHVLPQNPNLRSEWREALGPEWEEIQSRLLHTLGNLTLTGYNSEYSDRPFREKRDMTGGFAQSPLRLNEGLGKLEEWTEAEIVERGRTLAARAVEIWPAPVVPEKAAFFAAKLPSDEKGYDIEGHSGYLYGDLLELFKALQHRIMNLDAAVRMEPKQQYIAFKLDTNFVDVRPRSKRLVLVLNMPFPEIEDPKGLCRDIADIGKQGNGDVQTSIQTFAELDDMMFLIRQSFRRQAAEEGPQ